MLVPLQLYVFFCVFKNVQVVVCTIYGWVKKSQEKHAFFNPKILFLTLQSILCGIMAVLTLRMKFLWFPQMAVLAGHLVFVLDRVVGRFPKYALIVALAGSLFNMQYGEYKKQMANEQVKEV